MQNERRRGEEARVAAGCNARERRESGVFKETYAKMKRRPRVRPCRPWRARLR